jgi:hypothetical protein
MRRAAGKQGFLLALATGLSWKCSTGAASAQLSTSVPAARCGAEQRALLRRHARALGYALAPVRWLQRCDAILTRRSAVLTATAAAVPAATILSAAQHEHCSTRIHVERSPWDQVWPVGRHAVGGCNHRWRRHYSSFSRVAPALLRAKACCRWPVWLIWVARFVIHVPTFGPNDAALAISINQRVTGAQRCHSGCHCSGSTPTLGPTTADAHAAACLWHA